MKSLALCSLLCVLALSWVSRPEAFARRPPAVRLQKTGHLVTLKSPLRSFPVSAGRWAVTYSVHGQTAGELVDLQTLNVRNLPWVNSLPGFPAVNHPAPGPDARRRILELKNAGTYVNLLTNHWVWLDGEKNTGWYWAVLEKTTRLLVDAPTCADGKPARLIGENQKYYCLDTRTWVDPALYLNQYKESWLLSVDLGTSRVTRTILVGKADLQPVGMDPTGTYFVSGSHRFFLDQEVLSDPIHIHRTDLASQKTQTLTIPMPVRKRFSGLYSVVYTPSSDFKRIYVRESDEKQGKLAIGFLANPTARGHVANLENMTSFEFDSPIEVRSAAFSPDNQYLFINSVQLGTVTRIHLASRKVDPPVKLSPMGNLLAVSTQNLLFYFHEKGLTVLNAATMKTIDSLPKNRFLPPKTRTTGRNLVYARENTLVMAVDHPIDPTHPHQIVVYRMR